jgi:C4-dicarboxylate transporter DctQ subunit
MKSILKLMDYIEEGISAIALIVMLTITFCNVVSRFLLHASLSFADEITTYLFVLLSLMGTAIAAKRKAHLGLTILTDSVNFKTRKVLLCIGYAIAIIFSIALFIFGIYMVKNQIMLGQTTAAMQWPEWIYGSFVPFGAFFISVRFIQVFLEQIRMTEEEEMLEKAEESLTTLKQELEQEISLDGELKRKDKKKEK